MIRGIARFFLRPEQHARSDRATQDRAAGAKASFGPEKTDIAGPAIWSDLIRVEETAGAEFYIGGLFRRRFGSDPPDYPHHYVAFYRARPTELQPIGYIHYSKFEDSYLCGGMVVDERLLRRMPPAHRRLIRSAGGLAEIMLRCTFERLAHAPAIWGYVGDTRAERVDVRVGFQHTTHPHVMVVWNQELSAEEKSERFERIVRLGPF